MLPVNSPPCGWMRMRRGRSCEAEAIVELRIKRIASPPRILCSLEFHLRSTRRSCWLGPTSPKRILIKLTKCQPLISIVQRWNGQLLPFRGLISGFLNGTSSQAARPFLSSSIVDVGGTCMEMGESELCFKVFPGLRSSWLIKMVSSAAAAVLPKSSK